MTNKLLDFKVLINKLSKTHDHPILRKGKRSERQELR